MRSKKLKSKDTSLKLHTYLSYLVYGLVTFGIMVIYSSTYVTSTSLYNDPLRITLKHAVWVFLGLISFFTLYNIPFSYFKKVSVILNLFVLICLFILAIAGVLPCSSSFSIAPCINGANRWLYIPFNIPFLNDINFQPAELAKISIILYLSFLFKKDLDTKSSIKVYLSLTSIYALLIFLQPNLSTLIIIVSITTGLLYLQLNELKKMITIGAVLIFILLIAAFSEPYRIERIKTHFFGGGEIERGLNEDYHVRQISIAIGSGGFSGLGFGHSKQKYSYLPEVPTDSIFAIIAEEGGLLFSLGILTAYLLLILISFLISLNTVDHTQKLIASGIMIWLGVQIFINIFSMLRIIPLTGVPLPLISYGGSSLVFTMSALGILANIGKRV